LATVRHLTRSGTRLSPPRELVKWESHSFESSPRGPPVPPSDIVHDYLTSSPLTASRCSNSSANRRRPERGHRGGSCRDLHPRATGLLVGVRLAKTLMVSFRSRADSAHHFKMARAVHARTLKCPRTITGTSGAEENSRRKREFRFLRRPDLANIVWRTKSTARARRRRPLFCSNRCRTAGDAGQETMKLPEPSSSSRRRP